MSLRQVMIDGVCTDVWDGDSSRPPLLFVHGGGQGSWCWANMAGWFAGRGWPCAALNWYGRHGSARLSEQEQITRSITDVRSEIDTVAGYLGRQAVLVGHSMGGLASLSYVAAPRDVAALVLIAPVVPQEFGREPIDLPVDLDALWGPPPAEVARQLLWSGVSDDEARRYYQLLCSESPVAIWEATRWTVSLDVSKVSVPCYVVAADQDALVPLPYVTDLAAALGAECVTLAGHGHGIPLDPGWETVAASVERWLLEHLPAA